MALSMRTGGDSHGRAVVGVLSGLSAGVPVAVERMNEALRRRKALAGRSERATVEEDVVVVLGGVWRGRTTGAPFAVMVENRGGDPPPDAPVPRPGHGDLGGMLKYGLDSYVPVAERRSARETVVRCAFGAVASDALRALGVRALGFVVRVGDLRLEPVSDDPDEMERLASASPFRAVVPPSSSDKARSLVELARADGTTLGGAVRVAAWGVPPGLGDPFVPERAMDARIGGALLSVPSVKSVLFGDERASYVTGGEAHGSISGGRAHRSMSGGVDGGVTNGDTLLVECGVKPVPTQDEPLQSENLVTGEPAPAPVCRHDTLAVPAVACVAEAVVALALFDAMTEGFSTFETALAERRARGDV